MHSTLTSFIADEVRVELVRRRRTQAELAECLGVSQATVARRLSGKAPFDTAELERVAAFLDVPVAEIIARWTPVEGAA